MHQLIKFTFLIFAVIGVLSCAGDDKIVGDEIVGKWEYVSQFENDVEFSAQDCKPSTVSFTTAGTRNDIYYHENSANECVVVDNVHSTWVKIDANSYKFTQDGFDYINMVTFQNSGDLVTFENSDSDGLGNIVTYKFVYRRIE